jgi:hypothetical protein
VEKEKEEGEGRRRRKKEKEEQNFPPMMRKRGKTFKSPYVIST